jgi:hypothetical protein
LFPVGPFVGFDRTAVRRLLSRVAGRDGRGRQAREHHEQNQDDPGQAGEEGPPGRHVYCGLGLPWPPT